MPIRRDYVTELMEKTAAAMRAAAGLNETGDPAGAEGTLAAALHEATRVDPGLFLALPLESCVSMLSLDEAAAAGRLVAAAELLVDLAALYEKGGRAAEAAAAREKARGLYEEAERRPRGKALVAGSSRRRAL